LSELGPFARTVAFQPLERLSPAAGRALLRLAGVRGVPEPLLERASRILNGHALALRLLAAWLTELPRQLQTRLELLLQTTSVARDEETSLLLRWLVDDCVDSAGRELLALLGVLDGVAESDALERLRAEPIVPGLNERIQGMNDRDWQRLVVDLRRRGLLSPGDDREPERLATHPSIVRHFAERLRASAPEAWSAAHRRLSHHYGEQTIPGPETLAQARPALRAVFHGACAGDLSSALELFWSRVDQGDRHRATEINAPGSVLGALHAFYAPEGWSPQAGLNPGDEAYLVNSTGAMLRALGRLDDARALFSRALDVRRAQGDWVNASKNALVAAELALLSGHLEVARRTAEQAVQLATRAGSPGQIVYCLSGYADVLHHQGDTQAALAAFEQAEHIHRTVLVSRGFPIEVLYRWPGVRYGELLLTLGRTEQVLQRASVLSASGADISQEETACGMAVCAEALRLDGGASAFLVSAEGRRNAIGYADLALERLRGSNVEMYLPKLLTVRARNLVAVHDLDGASRDLERALLVARRNQTELFTLDARIEQARIEFARGNLDLAAKIVDGARSEAERMGYGRASGQLLEIERSLSGG
jgi:tetratricopeptide (TPR) repeat protein